MPDKPKRRKNNKNKRKNKNNKPDSSKNTSELNNIDNSEPCSSHNYNEQVTNENYDVESIVSADVESDQLVAEVQNTPGTSCRELDLNEDLHNNNSILQGLNTTLLTVEHIQGNDNIENVGYVVESPDQPIKSKAKLSNTLKSKSLDNDDDTKIVEVTDDCIVTPVDNSALDIVDSNNVIITDAESDVEWEKTDDFNDERPVAQELATGSLSITTIPLNVAQCGQTKCLSPDEEKSLRCYLKTLNLSTEPENVNSIEIKTEIEQIINREIKQRLRKKGLAEDFITHRLGPPRVLDVIDEEGSSESSMTSRRQSYLSEKRSDVEDLDDDVFEDKVKSSKQCKAQQSYSSTYAHNRTVGHLVPQECVLVGAKIKEPEVSEARGNWTMKTVEKMTGAEIVYLTDTSSSTSSLHEIEDDDDGIETDVSVRMITPTIEVTDTENFLKKSFMSDLKNNIIEIKKCDQSNNDTINIQVKSEKSLNGNSKQSNLEIENIERVIKIDLENNLIENRQGNVDNTSNVERIIKIEYDKDLKQDNEHSKYDLSEKNKSTTNVEVKKDHESTEQYVGHTTENDKPNIKHTGYKTVSEANTYKSTHNQVKETEEQESLIQNIENSHEIIVLSTDDIKTNLYVKDISENAYNEKDTNIAQNNKSSSNITNKADKKPNEYDLEAKIIKCEFNDAINNLIKEVSSDSETSSENLKDTFSRQDSSSSVSSQSTAKYNPNYSSLNDVSNTHDDTNEINNSNTDQTTSTTSHVKDVFECVTGSTKSKDKPEDKTDHSLKLRDLCVKRIASLPYGEKILEELASVSQRLQNIAFLGSSNAASVTTASEKLEKIDNMPLPDVSPIEKISLKTKVKDPIPPPVQPRHSSLKKSQEDDHRNEMPTKTEPVYVCLSPSQKMLIEKTNTVITKVDTSHLVDMQRKVIDRRGYNETFKNETQKDEIDSDNQLVVPFKSQTGSRLLALIRDPNLTRNINSVNQRLNQSLDGLHTNYTVKETVSKSSAVRDFSFKPIPPPRPKKIGSSFYESDESSDFTDSSMRSIKSERKFFHYSTGNLNKEIENDISSIQKMHRFYTHTRDGTSDYECPRRPSLPKDLCEQQMEYIRKKEKEVEAEIQRLESLNNRAHVIQRKGPRAPLISDKESERMKDPHNYFMSHKRDLTINSQGSDSRKGHNETGKMTSLFSSSQEEILREKMYSEYVTQMAERQERKQHKIIKITNAPDPGSSKTVSKSMPALDVLDSKVNNRIEKEFISKAKERWDKLGIRDPETEDERETVGNVYKEPKVIEHKIKVIEGGEEKDVKKLPSHLQEFVRFTVKDADQGAGSSGESESGPASPHLVIMCAVIIIVLAIGKYFLRLLRNK